MKIVYLILSVLLIEYFTSCNFNVTDIPGPQISTTMQSSQKHGTFICEYKASGNVINGKKIESIFAERKYNLSEGLFGKFTVSCCTSQLVVVSDDLNYPTLNDIPQNWEMVGFRTFHDDIVVKNYDAAKFPDILVIQIRPDVNKDSFQNVVLYKTKRS